MARRLVLTLAVAALATGSDVRAISVTEGSGSGYEPCSVEELLPLESKIVAESSDCAMRSTYDWNSKYLPTKAERQALCSCTLLINKLQQVTLPHCGFYRESPETNSGGFYSYQDLVEFTFGLCTTSSSSTTSTTTSTTTTRTNAPATTPTPSKTPSYYDTLPTYTPFTYSPSFDLDTSTSSSSKKSKSKTGLIVGILVAVGVVAAIAAFVVRKKKKSNANKATRSDRMVPSGKPSDSTNSLDSDAEAGVVHAAVGVQGELSPLGAGTAYAKMPPSPSAPEYKHIV